MSVLIALSKILCTLKNYDEAEKYAQSAYRITTRNVELLLILGMINQSQGDLDQAIRFTAEAIKVNPLSVDANIALGTIYLERHQKDFAETVIRKALKLMPKEFRLYDFLATLFTSEGNYKEAIKILEIAFRTHKTNPRTIGEGRIIENLRVTMQNHKNPSEALIRMEINRHDCIRLLNNGLKIGNTLFCEQLSRDWLKEFPGDLFIKFLHVKALYAGKKNSEADEQLKNVLDHDPEFIEAWR